MTRASRIAVVAAAITLTLAATAAGAAAHTPADAVAVAYDPSVAEPRRRAIEQAAGAGESIGEVPRIGVRLVGASDPAAVAARLARHQEVAFAEPDVSVAIAASPNDPLFAAQWALANPQLPEADIDAPGGWDAAGLSAFPPTGGAPIAIVDTGADTRHPDLAAAIVSCVTARSRKRLQLRDGSCRDTNGHGTHVAAIAAARANDGFGIAGVAFNSPLLICKALSDDGTGTTAAVAACIIDAYDRGARVINLSVTAPPSETLQRAVAYAGAGGTAAGSLLVSAAGNTGDAALLYPAAYPDVLSVAGTDPKDGHAVFSTSNALVDVAAPAVDVLSAVPGGGHELSSGTSMAAPHAAGAAALVRAAQPQLAPAEVAAVLAACADDLGPLGRDDRFGAGRIDLARTIARRGC